MGMNKTRYWAGGFLWGSGSKLKEFKEKSYWRPGYQRDEDNQTAIKCWERFDELSIGDVFVIKGYGGRNDLKCHFYGKVIEIDDEDNVILEEIKSIPLFHGKAPSGNRSGNWRDTLLEIKREEDINLIFGRQKVSYNINNSTVKSPLNKILYGPPGTGKTYNTINEAVKTINPGFENFDKRSLLKQEYDRLVDDGRIVFTTFHQSMSYEDFVEGIKPQEPDKPGDPIVYTVEDGIFKNICNEAKSNTIISRIEPDSDNIFPVQTVLVKKTGYPVSYFWKSDRNKLWRYLDINSEDNELFDEDGNLHKTSDIVSGNCFYNGNNMGSYRITTYKKNLETRFLPSDINFKRELYENRENVAIKFRDNKVDIDVIVKKESTGDEKQEPYVLIIDEINRGNVSSIFGELITLIEEDKRIGSEEEIKVQLPYSKENEEPFGVPSNLYILGTMNTADRSVEALDSALRRRFSFIEMQAKPELVRTEGNTEDGKLEDIDLVNILELINKRIEILLDRDHHIGHSYFLSVSSLEDLRFVFKDKIIPLLQEYFYGDYGKISLVLGEGFCSPKKESYADYSSVFPNNTTYDISPYEGKVIYELIVPETMESFQNAIKLLIGVSEDSNED